MRPLHGGILQVLVKTDPEGWLWLPGGGCRLLCVLQHLVPAPRLLEFVLSAEAPGGGCHGHAGRGGLRVLSVQLVHPRRVKVIVFVGARHFGAEHPFEGLLDVTRTLLSSRRFEGVSHFVGGVQRLWGLFTGDNCVDTGFGYLSWNVAWVLKD
jgi:hypothetical protein